ncbi:MAG: c-type cytochrome [Gammaproteobacteria bacterium]|jgi:cytochrome c553|nr:c-type cytochrome [Gammaproteobacteria bacterium]MBT6755264.1 c-type cytochrome [Gammaproteobacteria bacterium]MBT7814325.1 c-type cytochrome [Gammaproteobacteria bacterium]MDA9896509.1 c-type cytochrome [Gammaproteobacteria bacterium]MDC3386335.1 c-type cytochrome [Gammaproteobacteria bacterium]
MKFSIYVIWFFLLSITNVSAEKTPEELSSTCLGCHGVVSYNNIYPTYKVPKLGNQHKDYLVAALKAYRSGERTHLTMRAHASNLSDSDIVKIAEYFSSIKYQEQVTNTADIEMIEEANSCVGCHGADGNSMIPTFPKIAGQYQDYLYHALKAYKNGERNNAIMNGISSTLNEKQMKKLSKYFSSQKGMQKINQGRIALKKLED